MIFPRLAFLAIMMGVVLPAPAFEPDEIARSGLTSTQAKEIPRLVLRHEHLITPGDHTDIEPIPGKAGGEYAPGYLVFGVSEDSQQSLATTIKGLFAVSRLTGDIWELNLCKRYRFLELRQYQAKVMKRTGKSYADEREQRRALGCAND